MATTKQKKSAPRAWPRSFAPGDLAGAGQGNGKSGEPCPGCAGVIRDYCDACAHRKTRHILDAGKHSLCLCRACYALLLQVREELRPYPRKKQPAMPVAVTIKRSRRRKPVLLPTG